MRKPNITEGEWTYVYDNYSGLYSDGKCFTTLDIDNEEDLKSISAVPEMIDALIDMCQMYKELVECGDCGFWNPEDIGEYNQAIEALKKAGVEL